MHVQQSKYREPMAVLIIERSPAGKWAAPQGADLLDPVGRPPTSKEHINNHNLSSSYFLKTVFLCSKAFVLEHASLIRIDDKSLISNGPDRHLSRRK